MYWFVQYHMGEAPILYEIQLLDFEIVRTVSSDLTNDIDSQTLVICP